MTVYRCPRHGLIQTVWDDDGQQVCPINFSEDVGHVTDDLCQRVCEGPLEATLRPS